MNASHYTQDNLRITLTSPLGDDQLLFKSLQGHEALSQPFHFTVELLSQSHELDFKNIVGKNLGITIAFPEDNQRYLNGMVTRFIQAGRDARFTVYQADIQPWLWALTLTQNCRIFQHRSVPEIIKKVFDDLGFSDYRFRLIYPYDKRDYCVQYQESAFHFVCRLMEDVGIFYFFEHQADKHTLVLADDLGAHPECPGIHNVRLLRSDNETEPEDVVTDCRWRQQLVSGQYAIKDFNFEIPKVNLHIQVGGPCSDYRIYEYAAGFQKRDPGDVKVRRRIESQELDYQLLDGHSYCFSFTSGYRFSLSDHPR
jgi:type VI secretion system secreted protein VgrG